MESNDLVELKRSIEKQQGAIANNLIIAFFLTKDWNMFIRKSNTLKLMLTIGGKVVCHDVE